jgi:hypothetical protein
MSAASPEVSLVCEGALRRSLCHGLGRVVNNLTMPLAQPGDTREEPHEELPTDHGGQLHGAFPLVPKTV